jgi:hypothetical protein
MTAHCCEMMRSNVENTCEYHPDRFDCPDCLIDFNERANRYGLIILNEAGGGVIEIAYCPWCGSRLPEPNEIDLGAAL